MSDNYTFKKEDLDKRICDVMSISNNTDTFRDFIIKSEREFYIDHEDVDNMSEEELIKYLDFLDELWYK